MRPSSATTTTQTQRRINDRPNRITPTPTLLPPLNRFFIPRPPLEVWKEEEEEEGIFNRKKRVIHSVFSVLKELKCSKQPKQPVYYQGDAMIKSPSPPPPSLTNTHNSFPNHLSSNPFNTLFVGRLPYSLEEEDLLPVMEKYGGLVKSINIVRDSKSKKSKGYAFVEFSSEIDMMRAYNTADGLRIYGTKKDSSTVSGHPITESRRIVVDYERGRTLENWKPRRLGGGLGGRVGKKML